MAVTKQQSNQYKGAYVDDIDTKHRTTDMAGRVRIAFFDFEQEGVGDQGSSFILCKLPAGRVRLLSRSCVLFGSSFVQSNTLHVGWDAYHDAQNHEVAAQTDGIHFAKALGTVATGYHLGNTTEGGTKLFESQDGIVVRLTSISGAIAKDSTMNGYLLYVVD